MRSCLGILLVSLLLLPTAAAAHSNSVETSPQDGATLETMPAEATVTLNEAPKTVDVVLARPDGKVDKLAPRVVGPTITVRLPADGLRGAYKLSYRVVSADGHPVSGSVGFTITTGDDPSTPTPDAGPATGTPSKAAEPARGPLVPIVIGVAVLGVAASVLAARSLRR